jgi:multiple sugar transport system permease protein
MAERGLVTPQPGPTRRIVPRPRFWASRRFQEGVTNTISFMIALSGLFILLFPLAWMISTSLKGQVEAMRMPPTLLPVTPQWHNYYDALTFNPFARYFVNTFYYAGLVTLGEAISCSFIAYGFARLRAPGRNIVFLFVLSTLLLPPQVTLIPQFILFSRLGWLNSYLPLIVPGWFGSAYLIFLMRQFFLSLPRDYDEAALIDGASYLRIWWSIIMPLSKPAVGAISILAFTFHYNNYLGPLVYINDNAKFPVTLGLSMFRTPFGGTPWHWLMAASVSVVLPLAVIFFLAQRYFVQGIVVSGVKG